MRLNEFYIQHLSRGFIVLMQAIGAKDWEWTEAERRLLHNMPSLINESNVHRHHYFWFRERPDYLEWISKAGKEQKSRMLTYYAPLYVEWEPVYLDVFNSLEASKSGKVD